MENKENRVRRRQKKITSSTSCNNSRLVNGIIPGLRSSLRKFHSRDSNDSFFRHSSAGSPKRLRFMSVKERFHRNKNTSSSSNDIDPPDYFSLMIHKKQNNSCPCIDKEDDQAASNQLNDTDQTAGENSDENILTPLIQRKDTAAISADALRHVKRHRFGGKKSISMDSSCRIEIGDLHEANRKIVDESKI